MSVSPTYFVSSVELLPPDARGVRRLRLYGWTDEDRADITLTPSSVARDYFEQTRLPVERNAAKAARRLRDMASAAEAAGNAKLRRALVRVSELLEGVNNIPEYDHPTPESMGLVALAAAE